VERQAGLSGGLDPRAVEVALSRLLTGVGYHQPPIYFLRAFNRKDTGTRVKPWWWAASGSVTEGTGLFKWEDNPFAAVLYQGLIVMLMMSTAPPQEQQQLAV
jgi:hypothetical protein